MRKLSIITALVFFSFLLAGCGTTPSVQSDKVAVVATFYPLAELARQVGGDFISVTNITPAGAEPHDYEPTPQDILAIHTARIFLVNGAGIDGWAEKITDLPDTKVLKMQSLLGLDGALDGHFWLDPILYAQEIEFVRDALITADPEHGDAYTVNAAAYAAQLMNLDIAYKNGLANCTQTSIITSHEAFGYLAKRYNFTQISIAGFSPDKEPSPKAIADLATLAKTQGISTIFFESLVSPRLAQTVATEIGAQALVLNPLEGFTEAEITAGKNYLSVMQENLQNLRIARTCI